MIHRCSRPYPRSFVLALVLVLLALAMASCRSKPSTAKPPQAARVTATTLPAKATAVPLTATTLPTATSIPPTAISLPTATPAPPTPIPPTATPTQAPTETPMPTPTTALADRYCYAGAHRDTGRCQREGECRYPQRPIRARHGLPGHQPAGWRRQPEDHRQKRGRQMVADRDQGR